MATIDIFIGIILVWGIYTGFKQGLFMSLMSIVGFFLSLFIAFKLMHLGAGFLVDKVDGLSFLLPFLSFLLVYIGIFFSFKIITRLIKSMLHLTFLGLFDRISGALLGLLKACLSISFIYWGFESFQKYSGMVGIFNDSEFLPLIEPMANYLVSLFDKFTPLFKETVGTLTQLLEPLSDAAAR